MWGKNGILYRFICADQQWKEMKAGLFEFECRGVDESILPQL